MVFCFFCVMTCLSLINTTQNIFFSEKNVSMPRMDEKNLHTWEFQLKHSSRNMGCKLLQERFTGKTTECSKHLRHIAIEKIFYQNLTVNKWIFQIPLKYIKLVIPKVLFMLVLCSFNFYFKITWSPTPARFLPSPLPPLPQAGVGGGGGACPESQLKLSPLIQNRVQ